jgi:hypothetical protein
MTRLLAQAEPVEVVLMADQEKLVVAAVAVSVSSD